MKKSIKTLLFILCLCPIILLSACGITSYYNITVSTSSSVLGSVLGTLNNTTQAEGTSMTLTAKENYPSTNSFVCWIKDNSSVVSTDLSINIVYNSQNEGKYTALFEETNPNSMMYMSLTNIVFQLPSNINSLIFDLSYSRTSSGSDMFITLENGTLTNENTYSSSHNKVLYLGGAGSVNNYQYRLKLNITTIDVNGTETNYSLTSQELINNGYFNGQNLTSITIFDSVSNSDIILSFKKLNKAMFSE